MINIYSEIIDNRLTMRELIDAYAPTDHTMHKNRVPCPFHKGTDDNFSFNDRTYYCFVCGEKGNMISFVQKLFDLTWIQAVSKINIDFGLGMCIGKPLTLREKAEIRRKADIVRAERQAREKEREARVEEYWSLYDEWKRLDDNFNKYKPKQGDVDPNPLFVEACQNLQRIKYKLDNYDEGAV